MKAKLYKVKPGEHQNWINWCDELKTKYREGAIATLEEEGLSHEACSTFKIGVDVYVIGFVVSKKNAKKAVTKHELLNRLHRSQIEKCLEEVCILTNLYDFEV